MDYDANEDVYRNETGGPALMSASSSSPSSTSAGISPELMLGEAPTLTSRAAIKATILAVMAAIAFLSNAATLLSIAISRKNRGSTLYSLLFQLAIADLLVSLWCLSGEAAWTYTVEWKAGEVLCKIFKFSQVCSLYLSTSTMVLIGFDRLLAIRRPINHRSCVRPIGIAWFISALLASPQLAVFRVGEGPFREPFYQCVTYGFYTEEWQEQLYSIFSLLTMFVIPLIALVACYVCIFYTIAREKEQVLLCHRTSVESSGQQQQQQNDRRRSTVSINSFIRRTSRPSNSSPVLPRHKNPRRDILQRAKMKSLRISVIIVSVFVICWAPYYFMMITFIFLKPDGQLGEELQSAIFFFGMSNSLINPLIYGAFHLCRQSGHRKGRRPTGSFCSTARSTEAFPGGMGRSASARSQRRRTSPPTSPTGAAGSEESNTKRGIRAAVVVDLHLAESATSPYPHRHQFRRRSTIVLSGGGSLNQQQERSKKSSLKLANHLQDQLLITTTQHDSVRSIININESPASSPATPVTCL